MNIEGATPEELARGVAAAEAVFARAGITALQGAEALFVLEGWDKKAFRKTISQLRTRIRLRQEDRAEIDCQLDQ